MKSKTTVVIAFDAALATLVSSKWDLDRVLRACQGEANKPGNVTEGEAKRGTMNGGQTYSAKGDLTLKDLTMKGSIPFAMTWKPGNLPLEMVKFNDALGALFRKVGRPSGDLTPSIIPAHLTEWLNDHFAKGKASNKGKAKAKAPQPAKVTLPAPVRATTPAPSTVTNGNGVK